MTARPDLESSRPPTGPDPFHEWPLSKRGGLWIEPLLVFALLAALAILTGCAA